MARRFSNACVNACFKLVRNADRGPPFPFPFGVAVVVAQVNARNNRKVFILMVIKTVKKHTVNILTKAAFELSCQTSTFYSLFCLRE